jgi:hypothetical protein
MDNDIYLYDTERLHAIASEDLVKQGLRYFNDNRVIGVARDGTRLEAQVEDENGEQYWLELVADVDGNLLVSCDCHPESGDPRPTYRPIGEGQARFVRQRRRAGCD